MTAVLCGQGIAMMCTKIVPSTAERFTTINGRGRLSESLVCTELGGKFQTFSCKSKLASDLFFAGICESPMQSHGTSLVSCKDGAGIFRSKGDSAIQPLMEHYNCDVANIVGYLNSRTKGAATPCCNQAPHL